MDILNRLFGNTRDEDLTDEELDQIALDEKKDRARFHREKVANGPVKFTSVSNGQVRRGDARRRKAQARKANRRHRRDWMISRQKHAALRGQLIMTGALPGSSGLPVGTSPETTAYFSRMLTARYGSVEQALGIYQRAQAQIDAEQGKIDEAEALRVLQERLDEQAKDSKAEAGRVLQERVDGKRA